MGSRTDVLPKPLLPVTRKPLLAHVLDTVSSFNVEPPVVVVDYRASLIRSYFADESIVFIDNQGDSMIDGLLKALSVEPAVDALWCLSSDVLVHPDSASLCIATANEEDSTVLALSKLAQPGYKRWDYQVEGGVLKDVLIVENQVPLERAGLIVKTADLAAFRDATMQNRLGSEIEGFQSGWTFLLKVLAKIEVQVRVVETSYPVVNYNREKDLIQVPSWLARH